MTETALARKPIHKVVLVEPKSPNLHIYSKFGLPRLGAVLLGTICRDLGYDVKVMIEEVKPLDINGLVCADLVGISSITSTAPRSYELADALRRCGVLVVMGGPHPTHCAEEALEHCDYVVRGEGEEALPALLQAIDRGTGFAEVPNLSWHDGAVVRHNELAPLVWDLDRYPDPDLGLVEGSLGSVFLAHKTVIPIQTSRGCPYDCSFCTVTTTFGRKMRYRSPERVVAEMARHDITKTHFFIYDDNFTGNRRRAREIMERMLELPHKPAWSAQVRADVAKDEELLALMRRSGCDTVYVGLESVNQESLAHANKRQELSEVSENLRRIRAVGIEVHGMFVFGFDEDGPGTMERTVEFARKHDLFSVQLMILTPLPGSRWAREMEEDGRVLHHDWSHYDAHHVCFRPKGISPYELQRWQTEGHRAFYTIRRALGAALRGELPRAVATLYAANLQWTWNRRNRSYVASLERGARLPSGGGREQDLAEAPALPLAEAAAHAK